MKNCKVSVIIPYKEDRGWLNQAIQSVENQTYSNIELIISQGNGGVSENLNKGIEQSTGDFIKYLCDDDLLHKSSIERSLNGFKPSTSFIHGCAISFRDFISNGIKYEPITKHITLQNMLQHNHVHGGTLMYRKEVFEKVGMFNETLWTGEEYEFNLRCLSEGLKCRYVDEVLYYYRLHTAQKSIGRTDDGYQAMRKEQIRIIKSWYK